jgi:hypothetical protein
VEPRAEGCLAFETFAPCQLFTYHGRVCRVFSNALLIMASEIPMNNWCGDVAPSIPPESLR